MKTILRKKIWVEHYRQPLITGEQTYHKKNNQNRYPYTNCKKILSVLTIHQTKSYYITMKHWFGICWQVLSNPNSSCFVLHCVNLFLYSDIVFIICSTSQKRPLSKILQLKTENLNKTEDDLINDKVEYV